MRANPMANIPSMSGTTAAPTAASAAAPGSPYVQPTFNYALRIWWAFYWPLQVVLIFTAIGLVGLIFLLARTVGVRGRQQELIVLVFAVLLAVAAVVSYFVMHYILAKRFRHFRVALISSRDPQHPQVVERSFERVIRVWFAYWWRSVVFGLVAAFVASFPLGVLTAPLTRMPLAHALVSNGLQIAISAMVGLFIFYNNIIDEKFGDCHVTLLPRDAAPSTPTQANAAAPAPTA
jgi:hypothetical protein